MKTSPSIHLCIVQPAGYVHSLGFLDPALYVRHQLSRLGARVTLSQNRLREDSVNIVFGAHLGFARDRLPRHACVFFNLEQLGPRGAKLGPDYLDLLRTEPAADYDPSNVLALGPVPARVDVLPFLHASYLEGSKPQSIESRPIDLLFFGSLNERRRRFIERVERCGIPVSIPDRPLYGPERDALIRQSKAVLNCHFYDAARFERIRVQQCLSLGTPVLCERGPEDAIDPAFEASVSWLTDEGLENFLVDTFRRPTFADLARTQLDAWRQQDGLSAFQDWYEHLAGLWATHCSRRPTHAWRPTRLHVGAGSAYAPGWLNVHADGRLAPDLVLDLGKDLSLPIKAQQSGGGEVEISAGSLEQIKVSSESLGTQRASRLLDHAVALLAEGGELHWRPCPERAGAAPDAADLEAILFPWTSRFWESGAFSHRLEWNARPSGRLGATGPAGAGASGDWVLVKVATTLAERTQARMHLHDFGLDLASAGQDLAKQGVHQSAQPDSGAALAAGEGPAADPIIQDPLPIDPADKSPVRIHVAHYRADQLDFVGKVDPALFVPWSEEFNRKSRLLEFDLFKVLLERSPSHRRYWGVFSWKFLGKSGMDPAEVTRQIRAGVKAGADVIVLNPAVASNALFRNVFEQGQVCGHVHMETVAKATGLGSFVDTLMRHDTFAMSSYVVGTRSFWREYVDFAQAYLDGAQELVSRSESFRSIFMGSAGYWRDTSFDYRPFMLERLLQVFLHLRRLKVRYLEPDEALFRRKFGDEADALLRVYRLKQQATKSPQKASQWEAERQQWITDRARLFRVFHLDDPLSQPTQAAVSSLGATSPVLVSKDLPLEFLESA